MKELKELAEETEIQQGSVTIFEKKKEKSVSN